MPSSVLLLVALFGQAGPTVVTPWDGGVRVVLRGVADSQNRTWVTGDDQNVSVDAGTVDARGLRDPSSGRLVRWQTGRGSSLVWSFRVTLYHEGTTARFELVAPPDRVQRLRFARGTITRWDARDAGTAFPESGRAVVEPAVPNGESFVVQIAYMIPDNEQGGFHQVGLKYAAALNGAAQAIVPRLPILPRRIPASAGWPDAAHRGSPPASVFEPRR